MPAPMDAHDPLVKVCRLALRDRIGHLRVCYARQAPDLRARQPRKHLTHMQFLTSPQCAALSCDAALPDTCEGLQGAIMGPYAIKRASSQHHLCPPRH